MYLGQLSGNLPHGVGIITAIGSVSVGLYENGSIASKLIHYDKNKLTVFTELLDDFEDD